MKNCSLFCKGIWPFILLPLLLLLLVIAFCWRSIEVDVASNATQALTENAIQWATIDTHNNGRDVVVSGLAPDQQSKQDVLAMVGAVQGVRVARWNGSMAADNSTASSAQGLAPANFSLKKTGGAVTLVGVSGSSIENAGQFAVDASAYTTDINTQAVTGLTGLIGLANDLPDGSSISVDGDRLTLSGVVDALGKKKTFGVNAAKLFDGSIDNQMTVELAAVSEDQIVSNVQCQTLFNEITASETVYFESGAANVLPVSFNLLDRFTMLSRRCPQASFRVTGHTDSSGDPDFNQQLSLDRATAVVNHIVNSGVDSSRFEAWGLGESQPIADNATEEGRAKNRRVEFLLKNK